MRHFSHSHFVQDLPGLLMPLWVRLPTLISGQDTGGVGGYLLIECQTLEGRHEAVPPEDSDIPWHSGSDAAESFPLNAQKPNVIQRARDQRAQIAISAAHASKSRAPLRGGPATIFSKVFNC